ncbi:S-layer protein [Methanospirillum sp. J.3.6.1-F.2.7.3]|uniref:S-layer protein n=1 Tax=Methanospirillum purgamenti TaxID=2834276 RepID=A0A8E7AWN5_9EURY|nr:MULTISPECIES: S-layer protein [Methanospirillum]MDX8551656.1 S-layer protein [Methanospirillum hungatei]QVV87649.1 S-layer protein [Methanospirillum sp. J.3.6.1-F.2.7.3]
MSYLMNSCNISRKLPEYTRVLSILLIGVCLAVFCASPVMAGTKYLSGEPNLSVAISGINEFTPGTTVELPILIENSGLNHMKMVQSGIVDRDDVPSTAKMVRVTLLPDGAPILVKSDIQMVGDISGSESKPVKFQIRVKDDGQAGTYSLPVQIEYTYLASAEQVGTDSVVNRYNTKKLNLNVPFIVRSAINLDVVNVTPEDINAGGEGFVTITLKNSGADTGRKAIAKLTRSGDSPVVPVDSTVYIGEFKPGDEFDAKFKVSVTRDAEPQDYPLEVMVTYQNADGETLDTTAENIGIPVGGKIKFSMVNDPPQVKAGGKQIVEVEYRNDGDAIAYSAEARISAVDPFSSDDDLAYLGDVKPGESAVAKFKMTTTSDAIEKTYGLDSEIRYRDALDNSQISDTIKVQVMVTKPDGLSAIISNPIVIAVILLIIIGAAYRYHTTRRKSGSA